MAGLKPCATTALRPDYDHDNDNELNLARFAVSNFVILISNLPFYMPYMPICEQGAPQAEKTGTM